MGQFRPIRGYYPGQVITVDQSEASIQGHGGPIHSIIAPGAGSCHYPDDGHTPAIRMVTPRHQNGHNHQLVNTCRLYDGALIKLQSN